jgi:DNA-binding NarL/FixJ family response regulator
MMGSRHRNHDGTAGQASIQPDAAERVREHGTVRVFIAHEYDVVRRGLARFAKDHRDIAVVAEAGRAGDALQLLQEVEVDVALLDEQLPGLNGIELSRQFRSIHPGVRSILLTSQPDEEAALHAVLAGASGHLPRQAGAGDLFDAVRVVAGGGALLDPQAVDDARARLRTARAYGARLSPLQQGILGLMGEGLTNHQIGERLGLPADTVTIHVRVVIAELDRALEP